MKNINCLVCGRLVEARPATGRKSGKSFVMLKCTQDARHFRAFITDKDYVQRVVKLSESFKS